MITDQLPRLRKYGQMLFTVDFNNQNPVAPALVDSQIFDGHDPPTQIRMLEFAIHLCKAPSEGFVRFVFLNGRDDRERIAT